MEPPCVHKMKKMVMRLGIYLNEKKIELVGNCNMAYLNLSHCFNKVNRRLMRILMTAKNSTNVLKKIICAI